MGVARVGTKWVYDFAEGSKEMRNLLGGKGANVAEMTRILGAAIEQNHDERGMIWPRALAPFEVVICPIGFTKSDAVRQTATDLYTQLKEQGVDVILDDRDARPGIMFADWELIGVPLRITIGERGLKEGMVEMQARRDASSTNVPVEQMTPFTAKIFDQPLINEPVAHTQELYAALDPVVRVIFDLTEPAKQ